jgi:pimeloyl-[acyl-carrier protein] methyl ester esterase
MTGRVHRLAGGRHLAWRESGSGRPLVLLHGWSLSGTAFAELGGYLDGCRLLLPDLPGHGSSSPPAAATLSALADDLGAWLAAVAPEPVTLGGWSLGGMVAMELAARPAAPVEQLLLIGSTPRFTTGTGWPHGLPESQVRALRRNLERRFEATLGEFFALAFAPGEVDEMRLREIRALVGRAAGLPDPATAGSLLGLLTEHDQRPLLPAIRCPALVLHGSLDRVTPAGAGRALAAALPHGRLHEFDGLGHAPFWTRPAEVARQIRGFSPWGR